MICIGIKRKRILYCLCLVLAGSLLVSCVKKKTEDSSEFYIYYINREETKVTKEPFQPKEKDAEKMVEEFLTQMRKKPQNSDSINPRPEGLKVLKYSIDDKQLYLSFNDKYSEMSRVREILFRAATVKTFVQIPGIDYVSFNINDQPLSDSNDKPVGIMTAEDFVESAGQDIGFYEKVPIVLYFSNKAGNMLSKEREETVYDSNISMEKLVLEKLIKGPKNKQNSPTIPPDTKLLGVSVKDGTCYVNFDDAFLKKTYELDEKIPIYSVVNTLSEIKGIQKVQISINGSIDKTFRENIKFDKIFERDLNLVEETKQGDENSD